MALPLLLIPVLIGMAGSGAGCGAAGGLRLKQARAVVRIAEDAQADAVAQYMREVDRTREELAAYGQLKIELNQSGLQRHRDYITASGRSVDPVILADLEESAATLPDVDDPETLRLAESLIGAAVGSVVSGWALRSGLLAAVGAFGSASTGTPIAALTGAAANSATMAAIGGGSLAAGGGGVALGASLLGGVTVAPSLLVTGLTLLIRGEQSVTAADRFRAQVDAHVEALAELLLAQPAIRRRAGELFDAAAHLDSLLDQVMDQLDPQPLDDPSTLPLFQRALLLGSTLAQILTIPVVSSDRHVNSDTADYVGRTSNQEAA